MDKFGPTNQERSTPMNDIHEPIVAPQDGPAETERTEAVVEPTPTVAEAPAPEAAPESDAHRWHAEAGRKGARRVQQLIAEGRLYEKEHGLKRGRQRLRQLIELGKLYEQEHGLRPGRGKKGQRLSRVERDEVLTTLLECLTRLAKPSFRAELARLTAAMQAAEQSSAA
jgi:hypothetical protein